LAGWGRDGRAAPTKEPPTTAAVVPSVAKIATVGARWDKGAPALDTIATPPTTDEQQKKRDRGHAIGSTPSRCTRRHAVRVPICTRLNATKTHSTAFLFILEPQSFRCLTRRLSHIDPGSTPRILVLAAVPSRDMLSARCLCNSLPLQPANHACLCCD
jgi:hypothetical protein